MNLLAPVLVAAVCAVPASAQGTVTLTKKPPREGDVRSTTSQMRMEMKVEVSLGGRRVQTMDQSNGEDAVTEVTILAGSGANISKVRLEVTKKERLSNGPRGQRKSQSPLTGKTLILTKTGDRVDVTDEDGTEVDSVISRAAENQVRDLLEGKVDRFSDILPDREIELGETITVKGEKAIELFGKSDKTLEDATLELKLKGTKSYDGRHCAEFELRMRMKGEPQTNLHVQGELRGVLLVDTATAWPCKMTMTGPVTMKGGQDVRGGKMEIEGKGTLTLKTTAKYSRKSDRAVTR